MFEILYQNRAILLLRFLTFYMVLVSFVNICRVIGLGAYVSIRIGNFTKSGIIAFFIIACFCLFLQWKRNEKIKGRYVLNGLGVILIINIIGTVVGLYNGFGQKIIPDLFNSISGLAVCLSFYNSAFDEQKLQRFLSEFAVIFSLAYLVCFIIYCYRLLNGLYVYPALVPNGLLLVFMFLYKKKSYALGILVVIALILSMKRSIILSFIGAISFAFVLDFIGYKLKSLISIAVLFSVFITILFGLSARLSGTRFEITAIKKINQLNPFQLEKIKAGTSGMIRIEEVKAALKEMKKYPASFWIGAGNGFIFEMKVNEIKKQVHNVHISPFAFLTRSGVFATFLIMFFFIFTGHQLLSSYSLGTDQYQIFVISYLFGCFGFFFSYSLATDFLLWSSLGISLSLKDKFYSS